MKRITKWAVDHGFDRVAWVPGDVQAERYDLSKHIDELHWKDGNLTAYTPDGGSVIDRTRVRPDELPDLVGKEIADRLLAEEPDDRGWRHLSGMDLKIGGEGMKGFYDKILPTEVQKIVGKFGAKVGKSEVDAAEDEGFDIFKGDRRYSTFFGTRQEAEQYLHTLQATDPDADQLSIRAKPATTQSVHSFDITPEMRRAVQSEGLALFEERAPLGQWGRLRRGR
jgi:hypothetical protein